MVHITWVTLLWFVISTTVRGLALSPIPFSSPPNSAFSLVTWNLLAPRKYCCVWVCCVVFVGWRIIVDCQSTISQRIMRCTLFRFCAVFATKEKYHYCDPAHLDWSYRRKAIIKKLQSVNADIICLQEVQVDVWESDLLQSFVPHYTGVLQTVTRGHPVACAILVRNDKFNIVTTESRSRALILALQPVGCNNSNTLFLANVHLDAGEVHDETRFCQIKSLVKRVKNQVTDESFNNDFPEKEPLILLAGDFNILDSNPLYTLLSTGVWNPGSEIKEQKTRASRSGAMNAAASAAPDNASSATRPQFPLLPLRDLYNPYTSRLCPTTSTIEMTFSGGSVLDYIWVSGKLHAVPWIIDDRVLQKWCRQAWPSSENPSDHLPIGAQFWF